MPEPEPATIVEEGHSEDDDEEAEESNQMKSAIEENELLRLQLQAMQTVLRKAEQERDAAKADAEMAREMARKVAAAAWAETEASRVTADKAREEAVAARMELAWMTTNEETDEETETEPAIPSLPIPCRADGGCILCRLSVPWDSYTEPIE
jgi:hypothetical protein